MFWEWNCVYKFQLGLKDYLHKAALYEDEKKNKL